MADKKGGVRKTRAKCEHATVSQCAGEKLRCKKNPFLLASLPSFTALEPEKKLKRTTHKEYE
jgi:hypothetical protein